MIAIESTNLSKFFSNSVKALDDISFSLDEGEVYGFLGPNGSGKTTTVKLLNGVLSPTAGSCRVHGYDPSTEPEKVHAISGVLTEHAQMYDNLTGIQNLVFYANLFGIEGDEAKKRAQEMLARIDLTEAKDQKLSSFSTGMRQRLSLARAMLHHPKALFLDEPTSGLDPESAKNVNTLLKDLAEDQGTTIFLCTHQLRYAQEICTRYGLVDKGVLLADGDIDQLRALVSSKVTVTIKADRISSTIPAKHIEDRLFEIQVSSEDEIPSLVKRIVEDGGSIFEVSARKPSLEEIYFALIEKRSQQGGVSRD